MKNLLKTVRTAYSSVYFRHWIAANVAGVFLSQSLVSSAVVIIERWPESVVIEWIVRAKFFSFEYALIGLGIGLCQWLVIRRHFREAYGWIVAMVLGGRSHGIAAQSIVSPILDELADPISFWPNAFPFTKVVAYLVMGAAAHTLTIGLAQWVFFKHQRISGATGWIRMTMVAQSLVLLSPITFILIFSGHSLPDESSRGLYTLFNLVRNSCEGIIYGGLTGLPLAGFIEQMKERKRAIAKLKT